MTLDRTLFSLFRDRNALKILEYIKTRSAHDNLITKGDVCRAMDAAKVCSRLTTLKIIDRLLDHKILYDKQRHAYFTDLSLSESFDFEEAEKEIIDIQTKEIHTAFSNIKRLTK